MTLLGEEEGCPTTPPSNLDQLIAESFTRAPVRAPVIVNRPLPVHPQPGVAFHPAGGEHYLLFILAMMKVIITAGKITRLLILCGLSTS